MPKAAILWNTLPNAAYIQRVLDLMQSSPGAWEDDWNSFYTLEDHNTRQDATEHTRKIARKAGLRSQWNSAFNAAWAVEKIVHADQLAQFKAERAAMKPGDSLEGSKFHMFSHAVEAISALVTYEDCGYMIESDPLDIFALVKAKNPAALLLYPACVAFFKVRSM